VPASGRGEGDDDWVPGEWLRRVARRQCALIVLRGRVDGCRPARARENTDYGYLWWLPTYHVGERTFTAFAMFGTGGNKVFVFPAQKLVIVVTTTNFRVAAAGNLTDRLLTDYLLPALLQ
jgi:CubicO group peptidase (beta-lactamase class C family)